MIPYFLPYGQLILFRVEKLLDLPVGRRKAIDFTALFLDPNYDHQPYRKRRCRSLNRIIYSKIGIFIVLRADQRGSIDQDAGRFLLNVRLHFFLGFTTKNVFGVSALREVFYYWLILTLQIFPISLLSGYQILLFLRKPRHPSYKETPFQ